MDDELRNEAIMMQGLLVYRCIIIATDGFAKVASASLFGASENAVNGSSAVTTSGWAIMKPSVTLVATL